MIFDDVSMIFHSFHDFQRFFQCVQRLSTSFPCVFYDLSMIVLGFSVFSNDCATILHDFRLCSMISNDLSMRFSKHCPWISLMFPYFLRCSKDVLWFVIDVSSMCQWYFEEFSRVVQGLFNDYSMISNDFP